MNLYQKVLELVKNWDPLHSEEDKLNQAWSKGSRYVSINHTSEGIILRLYQDVEQRATFTLTLKDGEVDEEINTKISTFFNE